MEMIIKISSGHEDIEVLSHDFLEDEILEKKLSLDEFIKIIHKHYEKEKNRTEEKPAYFSDPIIGFSFKNGIKKYLINQPAHERFITYDINNESKGLKINFPASIYEVRVIGEKINEITAFMYIDFKGLDTELFKYGMPNMLGQNKFCIGHAKTNINGGIIQALENIIYAPYSHSNLNDVKGFKNTEDYFKYLETNHIQKKYLYETNLKLRDLVEEVK